jgi:hypothetical protein
VYCARVTSWLVRAVAVIALSLALVACGGNGERTFAGGELEWVRGISVWLHRFEADVRRAEDLRAAALGRSPEARAGYERAVERLADCADRFDSDVGAPPVARLAGGAHMLRDACVALSRGERSSLESFDGDPGDALVAGSASMGHGTDLLLRGRKRLEAAFLWNARLPRVGGETGRSRVEPRFSRAASTLALRRIEVRCWSARDWEDVSTEFRAYQAVLFEPSGFVGDIDSARVNLAPWICAHLVDLAYAHRVRRGEGGLETADAVNTLAHEAEHVIGPNGSEAETECYALQDVRRVARLLGASGAYADELAARQWREAYPRETPEYTTPLCYDGGPLDANPETSRWP